MSESESNPGWFIVNCEAIDGARPSTSFHLIDTAPFRYDQWGAFNRTVVEMWCHDNCKAPSVIMPFAVLFKSEEDGALFRVATSGDT